jgi:hypothetical protein
MTKTSKEVVGSYSSWALICELYRRFEVPLLYAWVAATYAWVLVR